MNNPQQILENLYSKTIHNLNISCIKDNTIRLKVELICRCVRNKAPIRLLMSCLLAKFDKPNIDIRKPYTKIGGNDSYSGRSYDEKYIQSLIFKYDLPCNQTTAFLTPGFRNLNKVLSLDLDITGGPKDIYINTLELLDLVYQNKIKPLNLLQEIIRLLIIIKNENYARMQQLINSLKPSDDILSLSSEQIVNLLYQHLSCKNSSRLPVLIVTAAYLAVAEKIGETALPLQSHTAADKQTGSIGDVEVILTNENKIVTCYEMKNKKVTINDIKIAIGKIPKLKNQIDNYIFITTHIIEDEVKEYAKQIYEDIGVEIAILDCLGFIRHYLHFFHRYRNKFLNKYQDLVLKEPTSSVNQSLKEAFLALRQAAEADNNSI